ncbi:MAG TPA: 30S ribosomal protein S8 [Candidatus Ratteibacteria bacterium]|uniref:Small ribosomal subunit protein uS8 n=1 Tax=candidate division TA06 bacterium ADurb.Bin131 TaxID=1852827 RepID=A0A1V6C4K5_UNCT6|nr:MAG: 30S ribosomal protein S8 [candidate division TA06 bacterium ADurb.Bin131]HOC03085.1 30S ribosomal protein S8 [bacterium]HRS07122.1 30S ribosomal protein S8 [Candidatus Ratteibacteria bacterium]HON04865.1 30S ribosomal protein S8 [bacterium]HPC29453.1 30S ribosomal protein S8 [bacterium]
MVMSDPVADMIIRLKNANIVLKPYCDMPWSKIREGILAVLKEENYIKDWEIIENNGNKVLRIHLLYLNKKPAILKVRKISKPGQRIYMSVEKISRRRQDSGIAVLSTSKGILSSRKASELNVGGELLFYIW